MSEEQPKKPNGAGNDPMKRLASLKPSRDLSLGGAKPNKKVFIPNLNVARNKNKGASTSGVAQPKREDRNQRDRRNDKNKNFNKPGSKIIKSSGVFSEGLGSSERRHGLHGSYSRDGDPNPVMQKPTIRVKDVIKIDKELEEEKIRSVMGDCDVGGDTIADFARTTERDAPIKLPMGNRCSKPKPEVKVKEEVIVKTEPQDDDTFSGPEKLKLADVKIESYEESEVVDVLRSKEPTLILLQLPDTLPGRGGGREDEGPRQKGNKPNEPTTSTGNTEKSEEEKPAEGCHLSDLEEGRIGTLRTHRSGRVTLLLGDTVFEVNMGTTPAFHQELISVSCDDQSRSASLVSLGSVRHSVNIVPQWETLLKDVDT